MCRSKGLRLTGNKVALKHRLALSSAQASPSSRSDMTPKFEEESDDHDDQDASADDVLLISE